MPKEKLKNSSKAGKKKGISYDDTQSIYTKNLGKSINGKKIVRDVSISLKRGEVVGLLGPNGAGKTTTFYMIAGLFSPDHGKIFLDGQDITNLPIFQRAKLGIGYLPQESSIFKGMNVEDNIASILEFNYPSDLVEKKLEELLAEFGISHLRNSSALSLSGGERRRVEIARCLASSPKYLLFDEPLAGVDPIAISQIKELIIALKQKGIGILITDHNVRDALDMIDHAYIIHEGKVLIQGNPKKVVKDEMVRRVYLGQEFELYRRSEEDSF